MRKTITKSSPLLEEIERQIQNAIGIFDEIYNDSTTLSANPTANEVTTLIEKSKNHTIQTTRFRNTDSPKIIFYLHNEARVLEAAQQDAKE